MTAMDILVQRDQPAKMRDGTVLRADIYRPAAEGRYPAVMERIPYGKARSRSSQYLDPVAAAEAGLVVVAQDTRGQGQSEGRPFYPFLDDFDDGYDTAEWIARLPFSNGRVGAYGMSYGGNSSWQAAVANPPSIGAIAPIQSPIDWVEGWHLLTRDGVLKWGLLVNWTLSFIIESQVRRFSSARADLDSRMKRLAEFQDNADELFAITPLTKAGDLLRELAKTHDTSSAPPLQYFTDVLHRRTPTDWETGLGHDRSHRRVTVPVFLTAGWYDVILGHDLEHFSRMRRQGATETAREATRLLIGPWSHGNFTNVVGDRDFGRRSLGASMDFGDGLSPTLIEWFKAKLGATELSGSPEVDSPRVRLFLQGVNRWRDFDDWPPPSAEDVRWFLHGGGRLSPDPCAEGDSFDAFVYDPRDPCPTCGGDLVKPPGYPPGPIDQAPILQRRDVLMYTSEPLSEDVTVIGAVSAQITGSTSGVSTDWVVKLCDVGPDGRTYNVCDGIVRTPPGLPDEPAASTVDLWGTAIVFRAGHRIRLLVTSSDFPRYERNPNTGEDPWQAVVFAPVLQRVFHDSQRASFISLPTIRPAGAR